MADIMVDVESCGTRYGDIILTLAACQFERATGRVTKEFYARIDTSDSEAHGFGFQLETMRWWDSKSEQARNEAFNGTERVKDVLTAFSRFYPSGANFWACGGSFDAVLLGAYYDRLNMERPWKFWSEMDARTIFNLAPHIRKLTPQKGTAHNSLDDARFQVEVLVKTLKFLKI